MITAVRFPEGLVKSPLSAAVVADAVVVPEMVELVFDMESVESVGVEAEVEVGILFGAEVDFGGRISMEGIWDADAVSMALAMGVGRGVGMDVVRTLEALVCGGGAGAMLYLCIFILLFLRWLMKYIVLCI